MQEENKKSRFVFEGDATKEIVFPLGGIGTGSVGLTGNGQLMDWEIYNRPNKGSDSNMTHFAIKAEKNGKLIDARILNSDLQKDLMGQYSKVRFGGYGFGPKRSTMAGMPHFRKGKFTGKFPFAELELTEDAFPGVVRLKAFNPFIPGNEDDSGLPAAFFAVEVENNTEEEITYTPAFTVLNHSEKGYNKSEQKDGVCYLFLDDLEYEKDDPQYGNMTVAVLGDNISVQDYWYRGLWFDGLTVFWKNFTQGALQNRTYDTPAGQDVGTVAASFTVPAGQKKCVRFLLSWSYPNCCNYWNPLKDEATGKNVIWKNYYATKFADSRASAEYCLKEWDRLERQSRAFQTAMFASTLPEVVIDAITAPLSVLKSPTVLRLEDGSLYGWEGVHEQEGSCEGTCTHVWSYAYAVPFLFPRLERSLRELDFTYNQEESGKMVFRMTLPLGREKGNFRACVDGQMGGIIKTYRDWKICGDDAWLKKWWPAVKKSLEFAWNPENPDLWDKNKDGILEGRQHHTLDMELFGPSAWLESMYLAALKAAYEMAKAVGDADAEKYLQLFENGKKFCNTELFNGEYFDQKIDLKDRSILAPFSIAEEGKDSQYSNADRQYWNEEVGEIKYQIANGCEIDQALGQWHADICGLGEIFDADKLNTALHSIYRYNHKDSVRNFANFCRLYCLNDESGTVMCEYPEHIKAPMVPVPYCQETMHGFEYQAAGSMISRGMIAEGLEVIRGVRDRYAGYNRNPWNEMECGSNYARSMASFALLPIIEGFTFDMSAKEIGFAPKQEFMQDGNFQSVWSLDAAWGEIKLEKNQAAVQILGGKLPLKKIHLPAMAGKSVAKLTVDGAEIKFCVAPDGTVSFEDNGVSVEKELNILYQA